LVTSNSTQPNANAGVDKVLTCTTTSIALSGSSSTAGVTFSWVASNGGIIVSGGDTATPTVSAASTYTLTVTDPANGCTASDIVLVTNEICVFEGCTLGYWKNHTDRWCDAYSTCTLYNSIFTASTLDPSLTLLEALNLKGNTAGENLARQSVAALLNICSEDVDYSSEFATISALQSYVNGAFTSGDINMAGSHLDLLNNAGCPLGGSKANTSPSDSCTTTSKMEPAGFDAYPVPFKDVLTIQYKFDYVSDVKIEVVNATGRTVLTKEDMNSYLNKEVALNLKMNRGQEQVYVVKVTTNRGSSVKKVMSSK
jgi:hypothetical protein